jgi:hypothetical protein
MKMTGGTLQEAVDSFDHTRQADVNYLRDFIETTLAPSLAGFIRETVGAAFIKWDAAAGCFQIDQPMKLSLYPESSTIH